MFYFYAARFPLSVGLLVTPRQQSIVYVRYISVLCFIEDLVIAMSLYR